MKRIEFTEPTFFINVVVCWDCDEKSLNRFTKRRFGRSVGFTGEGLFSNFEASDGGADVALIALAHSVWLDTPNQQAVLAHECLHATIESLRRRGLTLTRSSEESYCYVLGALIERAAAKMSALEQRLYRKKG